MIEPKKPFYRRIWFIVASILVLMFALIAAGFYFGVIVRYEEKAAEFDLKKLDEIESASVVYDRYGEVYGKIFIQNREQVSLDQISPNLVNAVISAEDNRFYEHSGVDLWGIFRAAFKNTQAGRIRQGASTLTQQLARNTFDLKDRTYDRKILEVFLAMRIDKAVPKNKILELYLNRVYFGGGLYGAEAAARGYFGKSAKDLSIGESAMLAGLLKSPNNLSPWHSREAAANERDFVLGRRQERDGRASAGTTLLPAERAAGDLFRFACPADQTTGRARAGGLLLAASQRGGAKGRQARSRRRSDGRQVPGRENAQTHVVLHRARAAAGSRAGFHSIRSACGPGCGVRPQGDAARSVPRLRVGQRPQLALSPGVRGAIKPVGHRDRRRRRLCQRKGGNHGAWRAASRLPERGRRDRPAAIPDGGQPRSDGVREREGRSRGQR